MAKSISWIIALSFLLFASTGGCQKKSSIKGREEIIKFLVATYFCQSKMEYLVTRHQMYDNKHQKDKEHWNLIRPAYFTEIKELLERGCFFISYLQDIESDTLVRFRGYRFRLFIKGFADSSVEGVLSDLRASWICCALPETGGNQECLGFLITDKGDLYYLRDWLLNEDGLPTIAKGEGFCWESSKLEENDLRECLHIIDEVCKEFKGD